MLWSKILLKGLVALPIAVSCVLAASIVVSAASGIVNTGLNVEFGNFVKGSCVAALSSVHLFVDLFYLLKDIRNSTIKNAFQEYFNCDSKTMVAIFMNLGKNAVLLSPCPQYDKIKDLSIYSSLAPFVRYLHTFAKNLLMQVIVLLELLNIVDKALH